MNRGLAFLALLTGVLVCLAAEPGASGATAHYGGRASTSPGLPSAVLTTLPADQGVAVIVHLRGGAGLTAVGQGGPGDRLRHVVTSLRATSGFSQKSLRRLVNRLAKEGEVGNVRPLWITNAIALHGTPAAIRGIARHPDVLEVVADGEVRMSSGSAAPAAYGAPEANLGVVNAPVLWDQGFTGQGVVIATLDSGVFAAHPDLAAQQRPTASWLDPHGQHASPADLAGHGTSVMGAILGRDAGGTSIGVAPDAQWISAKIFDDAGVAQVSAIHTAFQWVLDPDGNPSTADSPSIVNNSWSFASSTCNLEFQADVQALRAVGIVPVFAAGNLGPGIGTSVSPANYPESLAVGASNNADVMYGGSSRGPSACDGGMYPDVVAPGVLVRSSDLYGGYVAVTGTSISAPHVTGGLALLMSAFPSVPSAEIESALVGSAVDAGGPGPDNDYGNGRIDVAAAFQALVSTYGTPTPGPTATPSATPTVTPSPTPTPTPTPTPPATDTPAPTPTDTPTPSPVPTDSPTPSPTPVLMGDANCDGVVSMSDALTVAQQVVGITLQLPCAVAGDVSGDGQITMVDALTIARMSVGL